MNLHRDLSITTCQLYSNEFLENKAGLIDLLVYISTITIQFESDEIK